MIQLLDTVVSVQLGGQSQTSSIQVPSGKTLMLFRSDVDVYLLGGDGDLANGDAGFFFQSDKEHRLPVTAGDYYNFMGQSTGSVLIGLL